MHLSDIVEFFPTPRGTLGVIHFRSLRFSPKRLYWLTCAPNNETRGCHAHKALEQYIFCLSGAVELTVDNGSERTIHKLVAGADGIHIPNRCWRELNNFSDDAVVGVLASADYDPSDYIYTYEEFVEWVRVSP